MTLKSLIQTRERELLAILVVISSLTKLVIEVVQSLDFSYYLSQLECLNTVGYLYPPDLPVSFYYLFFYYKLVGSALLAYRIVVILTTTLTAVVIFSLVKRLTKDSLSSLLATSLVLFNDGLYLMIHYGILKNVTGFLLYAVFLYGLVKEDKRVWIVCTGLQAANHELCLVLHILTLFFYLAHIDSKRALVSLIGLLVIGGVSVSILPTLVSHVTNPLLYRYWIPFRDSLWGGQLFTFNYPRFVETFTLLPVAGGLLVLMGVLMRISDFRIKALAWTGLGSHFISWVVRQGLGRRFTWLTQIPLAICLAVLFNESEEKDWWVILGLALCIVAPYLARFLPGAWI